MRNGLPLVYTLFRVLWSSVHVLLAVLALSVITIWFLQDNRGMDLVNSIWTTLSHVQSIIANIIKFPWGG